MCFSLSKTSLYSAELCVFNRPLLFSSWNLLHFTAHHHHYYNTSFPNTAWVIWYRNMFKDLNYIHTFPGALFRTYTFVDFSIFCCCKHNDLLDAIHFSAILCHEMYLYNSIMFILHIQRPIKCIQRGLVAKFDIILRKKNCNYTIYLKLIFTKGSGLVFELIFLFWNQTLSANNLFKNIVPKGMIQYHVKHLPTHLRLWINHSQWRSQVS